MCSINIWSTNIYKSTEIQTLRKVSQWSIRIVGEGFKDLVKLERSLRTKRTCRRMESILSAGAQPEHRLV